MIVCERSSENVPGAVVTAVVVKGASRLSRAAIHEKVDITNCITNAVTKETARIGVNNFDIVGIISA